MVWGAVWDTSVLMKKTSWTEKKLNYYYYYSNEEKNLFSLLLVIIDFLLDQEMVKKKVWFMNQKSINSDFEKIIRLGRETLF